MKNKEKFAKEIIDIACKHGMIAVTKDNKVVNCSDIICEECLFNINDGYICYCGENDIKRWAESEYVEKPTISESDLRFLDYLPERYKYMARDRNGFLNAYDLKVEKTDRSWTSARYITMDMTAFNISFPMIKWEDEEPWSIEDLKNLDVKDE